MARGSQAQTLRCGISGVISEVAEIFAVDPNKRRLSGFNLR
jgi:hypothetical protein